MDGVGGQLMLSQCGLVMCLGCCRCDDLQCIYDQLRTRKVRNMIEVLERVESSYIPAFKAMLMDVEAGEMLGQLHPNADFWPLFIAWFYWFQAQCGCNGTGHMEFAVTVGTATLFLDLLLVHGVKPGCLYLI